MAAPNYYARSMWDCDTVSGMKTSLDLDRELWLKFRAACVLRGMKAGTTIECLMKWQLAEWAKEKRRG